MTRARSHTPEAFYEYLGGRWQAAQNEEWGGVDKKTGRVIEAAYNSSPVAAQLRYQAMLPLLTGGSVYHRLLDFAKMSEGEHHTKQTRDRRNPDWRRDSRADANEEVWVRRMRFLSQRGWPKAWVHWLALDPAPDHVPMTKNAAAALVAWECCVSADTFGAAMKQVLRAWEAEQAKEKGEPEQKRPQRRKPRGRRP